MEFEQHYTHLNYILNKYLALLSVCRVCVLGLMIPIEFMAGATMYLSHSINTNVGATIYLSQSINTSGGATSLLSNGCQRLLPWV